MIPIKRLKVIVKLLALCALVLMIQTVRLHLKQVAGDEDVESIHGNPFKEEAHAPKTWDAGSIKERETSQKILPLKESVERNNTKMKETERPYISSHLTDVNLTEYHLALVQPEKLLTTRRMIYNRVPKCGSITMWGLISRMSRTKHFHTVASTIYDPPWVTDMEQQKTVVHINGLREPFIYNRHICFLDFIRFGYQMPVYINLIRHPVDRFVSSYYYQRDLHKKELTKKEYDVDVNECLDRNFTHCTLKGTFMLIPYFCGHGQECLQRTTTALAKAKENAAHFYAVVGLVEDMDGFLKVLGCVLPHYFDGIAQIYKGRKANATKNKGTKITDFNGEKLTQHMKLEVEFYHFLKDRFYYLRDKLKTKCNF